MFRGDRDSESRPVVLVRGDSYDDFSDPWRSLNSVEVKPRLSCAEFD